MKVFTKLGITLLVVFITTGMLWAQSSVMDLGPKKQLNPIASEAQFDLQLKGPSGLYPPANVDATVTDDDVTVTWETPVPGDWIRWDNGINNGTGIGLTNGGTFYTASHWLPADLTPYDGQTLTKVSFYANGDPDATYEIMIWTGPDAGTLVSSEPVTSFTVDDFNEVTLSTPVTIDASQELWFGYEVTHAAGTLPAGRDDGPAVPEKGDMISLDGITWVSMYNAWGYDYNWSLAAYVVATDATTPAKPLVKQSPATISTGSFVTNSGTGITKKFTPSGSKDLLGYNVYRNADPIAYTTDLTYFDENLEDGTYEYCVSAVYDEGESVQVCAPEVTVGIPSFDPPLNVTAEVFDEVNVNVDWDAPGGGPTGSILCVDRDGSADIGFTDDWQFIQPALDALGVTYDYFEVTDLTQDGPDLATMEQYDMIIWFTGESWQNNQTMTDNDEANLASFIDGGGNLFLSAHDYFYDRYTSAGNFSAGQFPYDYLGVASTSQDTWSIQSPSTADISGVAGSFAEGLTFTVQDIYTTDKEGLYIDQITSIDQDLLEVTNPTPVGIAACQYDGGTFKTAFTTVSIAAIVDPDDLTALMGNAVTWLTGGDSKDDPDGYNVYRDGTLLDYVVAPTTDYDDLGLDPGTYEYCVSAVYGTGESIQVCAPEVTVVGSGPVAIFCDDFESYNVGEQLVVQNSTDWTTWSNAPGSAEDPYIVDQDGNTVNITGTNDLVYVMPNYTSGVYEMTMDIYIPTGGDGYFNTLQEFAGAGSLWGMQVYFGHTNIGEGNIDAGGALAALFTFDYNTWMSVKVMVDLDADWGEFYLDDVLIHGWVWSTGAFGQNDLNQLGGNNFYAWDGGVNGNPDYYFDNYCLFEMGEPPCFFFDDFEAYNVGEQLVVQNSTDWTTWSNSPGSAEDPYIVDQDGNTVNITGTNDLVYVMPNYISGYFEMSFDMYIPTGGDGYFNTLQEFAGAGSSWGMQVYFGHTNIGEGNIDGGAALAQIFTFDYDTWMTVKVTVDLDADWGEFYLDDVLIHGWVWSTGAFGQNDLNQLGGNNFYAWDGGFYGNPDYYFDNYCFYIGGEIFNPPTNVAAIVQNDFDVHVTWDPPVEGDPDSYNIWRNGDNIDNVTATVFEYDDLGLSPDTYTYCVSAVYPNGESVLECAPPVTIDPTAPPPPPSNLETDVVDEDIVLTWDAPGNVWMQWDDGVNANAIGLTGAGGATFSVSSHWDPASLEDYNGLTLTKIQFYANEDPNATYTIKVWIGPDGTNEIFSQDVPSFTVDDWNVYDLSTPVPIDGMQDFWFGYEVTHGEGMHPAGTDGGPAIAGYGDMIFMNNSWTSLAGLGFDYNWNLAGYVEALDGTTELLGKVITPTTTNGTLVASGSTGISNKMKTGGKSFEGYNVYYNFNSGGYSFLAFTDVTTFTHEGMGIVIGLHCYEVTAVYDPQGESDPTDESCELITSVPEFLLNATTVYPNPASDVVNIKSDFEIESIRVYSHSGQIVADQLINNTMCQLNTSEFNSGLYLFRIETSEGTITKRIVIQ